jgi:adenosylcobinamide-GDP ribazoletransferase
MVAPAMSSAEPRPAHDPDGDRASAWTVVRGLPAAIVFLTRVPVGGFPYREAEWRWASAWFPLVGAATGALAGGVAWVAHPAGPWVAAVLAVIAALLITGAFHEDGLADTADALGGAYDRERLFAILKDSRIGSFGAAALVMALLLRAALLARLEAAAPLALVLAGAASRVAPVWLMAALPYVTGGASRSRAVARSGAPQALVATFLGAAVVAAAYRSLSLPAALAMLAVTAGAALVCGWRFHARAGGITGDFLGATQQVCECGLLLALVLAGAS